jgi:DNA polymerase III subunit beta
MNINVLNENLLKALVRTGRIISPRTQLPILQNIKLQAKKDGLEITATNMETTEVSWVGGKVNKTGEICVSAKVLTEFITSLPSGSVFLESNEGSLKVKSSGFSATIPAVPAGEFPPAPVFEKEKSGKVDKDKFHKALENVLFAAATDEGRPVLTGIKVKKTDGTTVFAATDGYRLSVKKMEFEIPGFSDVVIPARALMEVAKISTEDKEDKTISIGKAGENEIGFSVGDTVLITRLLDGAYPDFEKIIPKTHTTRALIDKELFLRAVKSAAIFARDNANIIRVSLGVQNVVVSANAPQVGENEIELEAKIDGDGGDIAFNSRFLVDYLSNTEGEEILFEMTGSLNPGVFKPAKDESSFHIIMPVRVQG